MVYKWYILPIGGLYNPYHLLGEPETAIENNQEFPQEVVDFPRVFQRLGRHLALLRSRLGETPVDGHVFGTWVRISRVTAGGQGVVVGELRSSPWDSK